MKPLDKKSKSRQMENHGAAEQVEDSRIVLEEDPGLTPLHIAAKAGDIEKVMKLFEEDADPCLRDKGGKNPYTLAKDKETRNIFRRYMAQHPDKWDWHAASVPSPLTDELEAAQAAKQAEKDAKRKAKEKERKKLKKAEERTKQAQAEAKPAEEAAKAVAASVRYDKDRVEDMFKLSKALDPKSKEYQEAMLKAQAQERERHVRQPLSSDYEPLLARTKSQQVRQVRTPAPLLPLSKMYARVVKHPWPERSLSLGIRTSIVALLAFVSTKWHWKRSKFNVHSIIFICNYTLHSSMEISVEQEFPNCSLVEQGMFLLGKKYDW